MPKCGIYKITNLVNNHCYIGQSTDIFARWRNHKTDGLNKDSTSHNFYYPLYQAFRKYGLENFSFEIIEECQRKELNIREKYWIKFYNSFESGYNQTEGGDSAPHFNKLTKEQVDLIIEELKNSTENSEAIGEKFGVSGRMIRGINSGNYFYRDDIKYPIRPKLYKNGSSFGFVFPDSYCQCCGKKITKGFQFCKSCSQKKVLNRPNPIELAKMISEKGFVAVGKDYSVTDNAIRKWCKDYNIPYKKKELIEWYNKKFDIEN